MTQALTLRVHSSIDSIDPLDWDALVGAQGSPFLEHAWLNAVEQTGSASAETGWHPQHLTVWRGDALVGAAPAYVKTHSMGEFVYDWSWANAARQLGVSYYPKLVVGVPFTPVAGQRLMVASGEEGSLEGLMVRALLQRASETDCAGLHVLFDPQDQSERLSGLGGGMRLQFQFQWKNRGYASFEDFLRAFKSKKRSEFRRERRRLAESGVVVERLVGDQIQEEHVAAMSGFYNRTCMQFGGNNYLNDDFWQQVLERFGHRMQLVMARDGKRWIAGAFNVQKADRLYGRYWGCSEERKFLHFEVCYYQAIEHCIENGLQVFEPGHGGGHKYPRGFEPTLTYSNHWIQSPRLDGPIRDFLERERAAVRQQAQALTERLDLKS